MARVTVVIPNYNGKKYLPACIDSLNAQSFRDFEVIVVDNGSQDGAAELLSERMTEKGSPEVPAGADTTNTPKIKIVLLGRNTGFSHAVNVGIRMAESEYVFLLNNDTLVRRDCIGCLVRFMDSHPKAFSAGAKLVTMSDPDIIDDCGDYYNVLGYAFAAGKGRKSSLYTKEREIFSACAGAAIYRRSALKETGLFDRNHFAYLEDVDLGYRARIRGLHNYIVPSAVVLHAGSAVSGSRHNAFKVSLASKNSVYLIYKNQPLLQWLLNLPFLLLGWIGKAGYFSVRGLGGVYVRGLIKGLCFCFTKEARRHKNRFRMRSLPHYLRIQLELWVNLFRMPAV